MVIQERTGSRLRNPQQLVPELADVGAALFKATGNGTVPRTTIGLVQLRIGQIVGSTYLVVLHTGNLRAAGNPRNGSPPSPPGRTPRISPKPSGRPWPSPKPSPSPRQPVNG